MRQNQNEREERKCTPLALSGLETTNRTTMTIMSKSAACSFNSTIHFPSSLVFLLLLLLGCGAEAGSIMSKGDVDQYSMRHGYGYGYSDRDNVAATMSRKRSPVTSDPRRIMCGIQLIQNVKKQCGERGTYSPYDHGGRVRRSLRMGYDYAGYLGKRADDMCSLYLHYEPFSVVTECCCRGCTRKYLEHFCARG